MSILGSLTTKDVDQAQDKNGLCECGHDWKDHHLHDGKETDAGCLYLSDVFCKCKKWKPVGKTPQPVEDMCACGHPAYKHGSYGCMKRLSPGSSTMYCACSKPGTSTYKEYMAESTIQAQMKPGGVWKPVMPTSFYATDYGKKETENEKIERLVKERLAAAVKEEIEKRTSVPSTVSLEDQNRKFKVDLDV